MSTDLLPESLRMNYEVLEWKHACAILHQDFPAEWADIVSVLGAFNLRKSYIDLPGGRKSLVAEAIDRAFEAKGWTEKAFDTKVLVDGNPLENPTHKIDGFKNGIALEIEWNNKDPFFDRDLNNFRILFDLKAISVGVIITRCDELQEIFDSLGRGKSYGSSTTHMGKLIPRVQGGGAGGCPLLIFGITRRLYNED